MKEIKLENIRLRDNTEKYASRKHRESDADFSSAGLKIGLCIALCIGLCIVNLTVGKGTNTAYTGSDDVQTGKLRFVQLPGMIEVFAGGDRLTMPVDYESVKVDENNMVTFTCEKNATVVTCSSGTVKAVGEDATLGNYVIINHGDIETYYYGLGYVTVEERQVINTLDTLGLLSHTGILKFKICKNGAVQDPSGYLPVKAG